MIALLLSVALLIAFDLAAAALGADSRDLVDDDRCLSPARRSI
jgi:hypothetical protein